MSKVKNAEELEKAYKELEKEFTKNSQKLAESEEKIKKAHRRGLSQRDIDNEIKLNALREDVANKEKRIVELKQQLADKDKEIESLTTDLQEALTLIKEGRELVGLNNKLLEQPHQDKISFCIEQLENVKETTECVLDNALKNCSLNQSYYDRFLDEIDNQIKAIKGEEVV